MNVDLAIKKLRIAIRIYSGDNAGLHRIAVVTRNVTDFDRVGVALLNPWEVSLSA